MTASKSSSTLAWFRLPSATPHLLDHGLYVDLQTHWIAASKYIFQHTELHPQSVSASSVNYGSASRYLLNHDVAHWGSWIIDCPSSTFCCISLGIEREFCRRSRSGSRSIGRGLQDMTGYLGMMIQTNCVDPWILGNSAWGTTQIAYIHEHSARVLEEPHK
jgi:hypothetical protein